MCLPALRADTQIGPYTRPTIENPKWVAVCLVIAFVFVVAGTLAHAQQPAKIPRIGVLAGSSSAGEFSRVEAFRQGLRDLGYVEGKNIAIEYRYANAKFDKLPALADELIRLKIDVLVVSTTPAVQAAKNATRTIPIVFFGVFDSVAAGLVDSLARPGEERHGIHQHCDNVGRQTTGVAQGNRSQALPRCGAV
jgi:putative tryptophan/tyrosine transport system substrate-binding protein